MLQAPNFYAKTPPAPAGVEWWHYNPGVPPLPDPSSVLGSNYTGYGWRYNAKYSAQSYTFSQLDKVGLAKLLQPIFSLAPLTELQCAYLNASIGSQAPHPC